MEGAELAILMLCICGASSLLYGRSSPLVGWRLSDVTKSILMGMSVATATFTIIRSPLGRRSGAHFNPAMTVAYFSIRRIHHWDAVAYILAQFSGGIAGVFLAHRIFGTNLSDFPVRYAVTLPGSYGELSAFIAESLMAFIAMEVILVVTNRRNLAKYSPIFVALMTVFYFAFATSISGYSVNPARSFSSAVFARVWQGIWIYFIAPTFGMVTAAVVYRKAVGPERIYCAKVFHDLRSKCPFECRIRELYLGSHDNRS